VSSRPALAVWLYGTRVAELSEGIDWRWTRDAYDRWGANSRVVSHLLPIGRPGDSPHPRRVSVFIDNLLPEGNARVNYAIDVDLRNYPGVPAAALETVARRTEQALDRL
jgi:hypothetical protein